MNMTDLSPIDIKDKKSINTSELQSILSCGRPTAVKIGEAAGARVQVGKRVLWNVSKIQDYLDSISNNGK